MASEVADLWIKLRLLASGFTEGLSTATAEAETFEGRMNAIQDGITKFGKIATIAVVGAGVAAVKMAGDWQESMIRLVTSAGEAGGAIHGQLTGEITKVSDGLLKMAVQTATSTKNLSSGMYFVESAGFHAADGLEVMRVAAEGAKAEGADTAIVAQGLTTVLHDMNMTASQSVPAMNMIVRAVADGKTNMQDFTASIGPLLAAVKASGGTFADAAGAMDAETASGLNAQRASEDLTHVFLSFQNPTALATKWMGQMGLSAQDLKENLGNRGLLGTLTIVDQAILSKMGPDGRVLQSAFNTSQSAAQDLNTMLQAMPTSLRNLSVEVEKGALSAKDYNKATSEMPANLKADASEFLTLYKNASSFNLALRNGTTGSDTFAGMLRKVLGDQIDANVAMEVGGANLAYYAQSVKDIAAAGQVAGKDIENWSSIQQGFNFRMDQAKEAILTTAIRVGTVLLPKLLDLFDLIVNKGGPVLKMLETNLRSALDSPALHSAEDFIKGLWKDLVAIFGQARTAVVNLWQALLPVGQFLAGTFFVALKTVAIIIKDVVGPAVVALTAVFRDHAGLIKFITEVVLVGFIAKLLYTRTLLAFDMFAKFAGGLSTAMTSLLTFGQKVGRGIIFDEIRLRAGAAGEAIKNLGTTTVATATTANAAAGLKGFGALASKLAVALPVIGGVAVGIAGVASWVSHLGEKSVDTTAQLTQFSNALLDVAGGSDQAVQQLAKFATYAMQAGSMGKQFIKPIDDALAQMVQSGNLTQANQALANIDAQLRAGGQNSDEFNKRLTAFNDAVGAYNLQQREAALSTKGTNAALGDATGVLGDTAGALDGTTGALDGTTSATNALATATADAYQQQQDMSKGLNADRALDDYTKSLKDLTQSFKDNGSALTGNSDAAMANRDHLRNSVQTIIDLYNANVQLGDTTQTATDKMKKQITQLINTSSTSDKTREAVKKYIDELHLIPPEIPPTKIDADISQAQQKIGVINKELMNLKYGDVTAPVSVPSPSSGSGHMKTVGFYAKGGFVTGQKGQPQLAIVHGGEYVVSLEEQETVNAGGGRGGGALGRGGGPNVTIIVNNAGSVIAERDLRSLVETLYLQFGGRRSSSYTPYKRS